MSNYPYHFQSDRALTLAGYRSIRLALLDQIAMRKHGARTGPASFNYHNYRHALVRCRHAYYVIGEGKR